MEDAHKSTQTLKANYYMDQPLHSRPEPHPVARQARVWLGMERDSWKIMKKKTNAVPETEIGVAGYAT